jgi:hypothetical protein
MKNLKAYIDQRNFWNKFSNRPLIDINQLTQADITELGQCLDCDMSPENLWCDGEISATQARRRARMYKGAFSELKRLASDAGHMMPETYELS